MTAGQVQFPTDKPLRKYAGASAQERTAQRRERLLDAAFDVFGREGYRNATMRLICAQARLTERYFYESFTTLDEVFVAVHRRQSAIVSQRILAAVVQQPQDGVARTRAGLTAFFQFIQEDRRCAQILLVDAITSGMASPLNLRAKVSSYADMLRAALKAKHPHLAIPLDADLVIAGFVGMIIQTGALWVARGYDLSVDVLVAHNLYAWVGLEQWLASGSLPVGAI